MGFEGLFLYWVGVKRQVQHLMLGTDLLWSAVAGMFCDMHWSKAFQALAKNADACGVQGHADFSVRYKNSRQVIFDEAKNDISIINMSLFKFRSF